MSFLSSLTGSKKAANAAQNANDKNIYEARDTYDDIYGLNRNTIEGGQQGFTTLQDFLGLNGAGTQQRAYDGYVAGPDVLTRVKSGVDAIDNSSAARTGGVMTGGLLKRIQEFGTGAATQDLGSYLSRLAGVAGMGQQATQTVSGARQNTGNAIMQSNTATGDAQANAALADGSFLNNIIGGAFRMAPQLGFNPFGTGGGQTQQQGQFTGNRAW